MTMPERIWATGNAPGGSWSVEPHKHFPGSEYLARGGETMRGLINAAEALVGHDSFDPQYLSADLNHKLEAVCAALAKIRGER